MPLTLKDTGKLASQAANGNGTLQRCVSLANGALSPDQRVNYEFGLVLGVDDFRQEQLYHLEKHYQHNRSLHGYGTVHGLEVTADRPADSSDEMLITVQPGLGIDQFGRPIVIPDEQCARLGAWYARQVQDGKAPPGGGTLRAYVVVGYDECLDALVPIPGQPCSSSEATQAPSRIRDAFTLELRWEAPRMAAWDAVRAFADLLGAVRFVPGLLPEHSSEPEITDLVRDLVAPPAIDPCTQGAGVLPGSPPTVLRLPLENAREALDRIFAVWATEVRPHIQHQASLLDPGSDTEVEAGILLACVDFDPAPAFDPAAPKIADAIVSDGGRPVLLHTQLIQELLLLGAGGEAAAAKELHEFATLQVQNSHELRVWVHHPAPLAFTGNPAGALNLSAEGVLLKIAGVQPVPGVDNLFAVTTDAASIHEMAPGARLALALDLTRVEESGGAPLLDVLDAADYDYLGRDGTTLTVLGLVERILPSRDLVTVTTVQAGDGPATLRLWFHTDQPVQLPKAVDILRGQGGATSRFAADPVPTLSPAPTPPAAARFAFQWQLVPPNNAPLRDGEPLIIPFDTTVVKVGTAKTSLADVVEDGHLSFLGYDGQQTVRVYANVAMPRAGQPPTGPSIEDILREVAVRVPALPFVTITASRGFFDDRPGVRFELWFHLDRVPPQDVNRIEKPQFVVLAEVERPDTPVRLPVDLVDQRQHNVFLAFLTDEDWRGEAELSPYLRFVFPTTDNFISTPDLGDLSLADYIAKASVKFQGHNGEDLIVAYVRAPEPQGDF